MRALILAGGAGSRLSEETELKPKPMVEIGGRPILWHIMKHLGHYGVNEFVVALGYRGDVIKRYFVDGVSMLPDLSVDLGRSSVQPLSGAEPWIVELCDTGVATNTAGRVARLFDRLTRPYGPRHGQVTGPRQPFLVTYGDGVSNIDLQELVAKHVAGGRPATVTAVLPPARFGELTLEHDRVTEVAEKPQVAPAGDKGWINGGYMIFEPTALPHFERASADADLAGGVLASMAMHGDLTVYRHTGFWQCMDTLREKRVLEALWSDGRAPWKVWA